MTMQNNSWTVQLEQDPNSDDLIMPLPPEVLAALDLKEGDTLEWEVLDSGQIHLKKKVFTTKDESWGLFEPENAETVQDVKHTFGVSDEKIKELQQNLSQVKARIAGNPE